MRTHDLAKQLLSKPNMEAVIINLNGREDEGHTIEKKHIDICNTTKDFKITTICYNSDDV